MKNKDNTYNISSELLAAYLDGNTTAKETKIVLDAISNDDEVHSTMLISQMVDGELGVQAHEILPMNAMAASRTCDNLCCIECETYILHRRGIELDTENAIATAKQHSWLNREGTPLYNIGRTIEEKGFMVSREYQRSIDDIKTALANGCDVMAAIDGGELLGNRQKEEYEDIFVGEAPDHVVVVLECKNDTIEIFDPASRNSSDSYPLSQFADAWADSKNYMITIKPKDMKQYIPHPIDLSDIKLDSDLNELREAIAENAHEIWAQNRQAEGWTYGPQRNDQLKQTPDMVPYSQLPEGEKEYDREMAIKTIKLLKKLGYDLIRKQDTELYREMIIRIRNAHQEFHCPKCKNPVYKHQIFCDKCGHELRLDWNEK